MSDSSDSDEVNVEVPYSQRPEWADIKPIPQVYNERNKDTLFFFKFKFPEFIRRTQRPMT
jgi:hypothetical protein